MTLNRMTGWGDDLEVFLDAYPVVAGKRENQLVREPSHASKRPSNSRGGKGRENARSTAGTINH